MIANLGIVTKFDSWLAVILEFQRDIQVHSFCIGVTESEKLAANTDTGGTQLIINCWCDGHACKYDVIAIGVKDLVIDDRVRFCDYGYGGSRYDVVGSSRSGAWFDRNEDVYECRRSWKCTHEVTFFGGWVER